MSKRKQPQIIIEELARNKSLADQVTILVKAVICNRSKATLTNLSNAFGDDVVVLSLIKLAEEAYQDAILRLAWANKGADLLLNALEKARNTGDKNTVKTLDQAFKELERGEDGDYQAEIWILGENDNGS